MAEMFHYLQNSAILFNKDTLLKPRRIDKTLRMGPDFIEYAASGQLGDDQRIFAVKGRLSLFSIDQTVPGLKQVS